MYGTPGGPGYVSPSGSTAKTLILVAIILDLIFALIYVFGVGLSFLYVASFCAGVAGCGGIPIFSIIFIALGALAFVWLILIWLLCYKPVAQGRYEPARTPTLVFTILSFVTLNILTGILLIIAYLKLNDAVRESQSPAPGYYPGGPAPPAMAAPMPAYVPPMGQPPQPTQAQPPMTAAPVCPKCGRPATFVPQYNRYYCYTDNQYV